MLDWFRFFLIGPAVGCTVYVVLQIVAAWKLAGAWRVLGLAPAPIMLWVAVDAVEAYRLESNLWPIRMIFAGPAASGYLCLLMAAALLLKRRRKAEASDHRSVNDWPPNPV